MKKNFLEYDSHDSTLPAIKPTKSYVPGWFKDMPIFNYKNIVFDKNNQVVKNAKNCLSFIDSLTTGYIIELWCDLYVSQKNDEVTINWQAGPFPPLSERSVGLNQEIPVPSGFAKNHYIWKLPYAFRVPNGYSCIFTHPLNRYDLPFITLSGIVDADYAMPPGNMPFFLNSDFEGLIPAGTPIAQIIPFKREAWKSKETKGLFQESNSFTASSLRKFFGWYKDNQWKKKSFE